MLDWLRLDVQAILYSYVISRYSFTFVSVSYYILTVVLKKYQHNNREAIKGLELQLKKK